MNSRCTPPIELIAADRHKSSEDCCLVRDRTPAPAKAACPISGTLSRKVQSRTLEHLLKPASRGLLRDAQYYFCNEPVCRIVYFSNVNAPTFSMDDLTVKVFIKDQGDDVPVCYCFDWTRSRIQRQIRETRKGFPLGQSKFLLEIAREIKAGNCACEIKNPKGECCLGDINAFVKRLSHVSGKPLKGPIGQDTGALWAAQNPLAEHFLGE